ncbi:MAG TPA: MXAN_2562 family outer membrane beta-barrel protein [Anaeromyxobacteraceae bacterium]|nr:MXAN_2562 family outer membrane beta-barrel protein [Anaeromyxobacteraceae bacterium]
MRAIVATALLLAASPALAESPRVGSFQLQMGGYRPNIDSEFGGTATPYRDIFGTGRNFIYKAQVAGSLYAGFGTLDLGFGIGWFQKTGKGLIQGTTTPSGDDTSFRILPLSLSLTYRFDPFVEKVPFAPYARASLERWQWWVTNGGGGTAQVIGGPSGQGATNGWSAALGLCFLLDFLDPTLAREMDRDVGVNHTYLFLEATRTKVDDFGSSKSWDLSDEKTIGWSGGILFAF